MKFTINTKHLRSKLDNLNKIAKDKSPLPLAKYFMVEVKEDDILITATNLKITLTGKLIPEKVSKTGTLCVIADKFYEIIKTVTDEFVEVYSEEKKLTTTTVYNVFVKTKTGKFKMSGDNAELFPQPKRPSDDNVILLPVNVLSEGIAKTVFASKEDDMAPMRSGVAVICDADKTSFYAYDGTFRMAACFDMNQYTDTTKQVVIPRTTCFLMQNLVSSSDDSVTIRFDDKNVEFIMNDYIMCSTRIEGTFPDISAVLHTDLDVFFSCNKAELSDAIKRCLIFNNEPTSRISVVVNIGEITVSATDVNFNLSAEESVTCDNIKSSGMFNTNGHMFLDAIEKVSSEKVEISFPAEKNGIFINPVSEEENYTFVVSKTV